MVSHNTKRDSIQQLRIPSKCNSVLKGHSLEQKWPYMVKILPIKKKNSIHSNQYEMFNTIKLKVLKSDTSTVLEISKQKY